MVSTSAIRQSSILLSTISIAGSTPRYGGERVGHGHAGSGEVAP